ncbi:MAG: acyl-CoA dehydrogenase family protein [Rudaea sp.]|nr:acyl-CoA dehydrogenase family protein [Rudaea sp.]
MDLSINEDHEALCDAAHDWLNDNMPLIGLRKRDPALFGQLDALGWIGMTSPDVGFDIPAEALVFIAMGRALAPVSALSSAVAARWFGTQGQIALAIPDDDQVQVFDSPGTTQALGLWQGQAALMALPGGLEVRACLDLSTNLAVLEQAAGHTAASDPRAGLHLALLAGAFALGCAEAARDMAVDYARLREQFGRQIGAFQAIKHMCADMAVRAAVARSQLYYAACALEENNAEAAFHVAAAKRLSDTAALDNARANIQIHGGIGMTDEASPHLLLKRAHLLGFVAPVTTRDLLAPVMEA